MHTRLAKASENGGMGSSFEFLRTHPVPERRIKVGDVAYFVVRRNKKTSCSTLRNSFPKRTRYAPPTHDVLVFVNPLNNFLEA